MVGLNEDLLPLQKNYPMTSSFHRLALLFVFFTLFLVGCKKEKTLIVGHDNRIEITLPYLLTESFTLHEQAVIQYQNLLQELYVIVLEEPKDEVLHFLETDEAVSNFTADFDGYARLLNENMQFRIQFDSISEMTDTKINGLNAKKQTFSGDVNGVNAYYEVALVEGKDHYYQILTWTLQTLKEEHLERMKSMIASFREY